MMPSFIAYDIFSKMGTPLGQAIPSLEPFIEAGDKELQVLTEMELNGFVPGDYYMDAWIGPHYSETYDWQKECIEFSIIDSPQKNRTFPHTSGHGFIVPASKIL
jgi:hypothetical protein